MKINVFDVLFIIGYLIVLVMAIRNILGGKK